jgi:peptidoglycan hydrolase-like protein with peptidoglycan-binding domain
MIESGPSTIQLKVRDKKLAAVQQALNEDGANLTVDGVMGAKTKQAIRAFQRKSGLMITGYPNKATLKKLNIQDTPTKK